MGAELFRKYVTSSMMIGYRSVVRHPFLIGMILFFITMYRLFPLLFSLLVSASPVIVSTAVLLGTLLSYGQPNIPEIEKESESDRDEIRKLESKVTSSHTEIIGRDVSFASEETNGSRIEIGDKSFEENIPVIDDTSCVQVDTPVNLVEDEREKLQFREEHLVEEPTNEIDEEKVVLGSRYTPLKQSEDDHIVLESDDKLWEGSADPLNSDPALLWKRVEGGDSDDDEGSDSGDSDLAESSSPDASMADIIPMLDELHPLLSEEREIRQPTHVSRDDSDAASEHSLESSDTSSESNDDGEVENHKHVEVGDDEDEDDNEDEDEDKESKHTDKEDETRSAITWTEDDQKNLMNLGTSELERNRRLENLILRRRARKTMRMQAEKNLIDLESDFPWNNIPPISTARSNPFDYDANDNIPGSAPSVLLQRRNPFDLPYDSSEEKPDLVGDTFHQEFAAVQPKEPFFRRHESFNVGPSIFGASRSERQETKLRPYFVPERISSDGSFSSFQRQLSGISDSKASSIPDTESVSSDGDLENKDHLHVEDDHSLETEVVHEQEQEQEHVSEMTDDVNLARPYFVPEQLATDAAIFSFQRQLSEVSESKLSSVPDTDSVSSSDDDLENKNHIEEDLSQEAELISIEDHVHGIQQHQEMVSEAKENVSHESESSEDDDNVEESNQSIQDPKGDEELDNAEVISESVANQQEIALDFQETENAASSMDLMSDTIHLSLGDRELHSSVSSLSSSCEASEQVYNEKVEGDDDDDDEVAPPVSETSYYFVDRGNSIQTSEIDLTSLLVDESQPKGPVYDTSPSVSRNLSSSSISNDLQAHVSEKISSSGIESQETVQKIEKNFAGNTSVLASSSEQDAAAEIESRSITDRNLNELDLNMGPTVGEDHLHKDESFDHIEDQHQSSSYIAETSDAQNQLLIASDNEEPLLAYDNISTPLPSTSLLETEGSSSFLDMDASDQLQSVQVPISTSHESSNEDIHQKEVIVSHPEEEEELSLLGRAVKTPSAGDPQELQDHEVEQRQVDSSNTEVIREETHENTGPTDHQFVSKEEDISQPQEESPLIDISANESSEENPEVLQIQELENDVSVSMNSLSSVEHDVVKAADIETNASENAKFVGDIHGIESNDVEDNVDDVDEIKDIDEDLLVELDAVGDFSVEDLRSTTLDEMKEESLDSKHDLEIKLSADKDSSILNEMKEEPRVSEHDLETKLSVEEDYFSKDLGSSLEHDVETKHFEDEDSSSKDLGSTLTEMKEDPQASEHDLETKRSIDEDLYSVDLRSTMDETNHDLETKDSVDEEDEDSESKDLDSTFNDIKRDPQASEHNLDTFYSIDEFSFSKVVESTLNDMKHEHDLETNNSGDKDEAEVVKSQNGKEISNTEVASASEAEPSTTKSINDSTIVNQETENASITSNMDKE